MPGRQKYWANVPKMVAKMYHAQTGTCGYCGTPKIFLRKNVTKHYRLANKQYLATFDHVVPDSKGGRYELKNGVCACQRCNTLKGDLSVEEFFERYDELLQHLLEKPARDAAKKEMNQKKSGYIIARFAEQIGKTVEDLFLETVYNNTYELVRETYDN